MYPVGFGDAAECDGMEGETMRIEKVAFSDEAWERLMRERKCTLTVRVLQTDGTVSAGT